MSNSLNEPLDLVLRRRAAFKVLSESLSGDLLIQAMWMIEERDHSADRLTFFGFVGVAAEIFGVASHEVSMLYIKLNQYIGLSNDELPQDPLPEMLEFRGIKQTDASISSENSIAKSNALPTDTSVSIFRDNDIRKTDRGNSEQLSQETVFQIGQSLAFEANKYNLSTIIMACDGHDSSTNLANSLAEGIQSTGLNVLDLGQVPLPLLYFVTQHFDGKTGVMITANNDPKQHCDLKMVVAGEILTAEKIQRLRRKTDVNLQSNGTGSREKNNSFVAEYIGTICDQIYLNEPKKIVLDSGNGIACPLVSNLMESIGCEVIELHSESNENFSNPSKLISAVQENNADIGFSFDNDGTRLCVIDNQGEIIPPDRIIMLLAKTVLSFQPGSQIILAEQCPDHLATRITEKHGSTVRCNNDPALIQAKVKVSSAKLAGDMDGRYYFYDHWYAFDDALYAASRILEILSSDTRSSNEVFAELT